jgi:hypothetical protein
VDFGRSVALSSDGNTAIVGEPRYNGDKGGVVIFVRNAGAWTSQTGLIADDAIGVPHYGWSVALSADGNTALVGGYSDNSTGPFSGFGAAWVYTRNSEGGWAKQSKLIGTGATQNNPLQGYSVALSGDGNVALVGGLFDNAALGATWVFTRKGTVWTQEGAKLVAAGATGAAKQGRSVAVSIDGQTAIIGGANDNAGSGAAWVFVRPRVYTHDFNADRKSDILWRDSGGKTTQSG